VRAVTSRFDAAAASEEMAAMFSPTSRVQRMLDVEAALARAEERAGVIPTDAADAIAERCRVELFDIDAVFREGATAGTPAIPLVRMLTDAVPEEARAYVHWGATSQDVVDTGMMLQVREALERLEEILLGVGEACAGLAERHAGTPVAARTLLQQALPTTFGLKAAGWLATVTQHIARLREIRDHLPVQFGGAAGTLAALGDQGVRVTELLAEELNLRVPDLPWHTDRTPVAEVVASVGILAGSMAKVAMDVALLSQTEVGEVAEAAAEGRGTSSAMPHKRNPVDAPAAIAAARLAQGSVQVVLGAMVQEQERGVGGWHAEWTALPDAVRHAGAVVAHVRSMLEGLEVHPDRMRANLDAGGGVILSEALMMALAEHMGRPEAYRVVAELTWRSFTDGVDLREAAQGDERVTAVLDPADLDRVFDPLNYLGSAEAFIRRAVTRFRGLGPVDTAG
jgi:3-carboxy-cis,cis-muconate cycloisomerase